MNDKEFEESQKKIKDMRDLDYEAKKLGGRVLSYKDKTIHISTFHYVKSGVDIYEWP